MNNIPADSRKVGMLCYVKEVDKKKLIESAIAGMYSYLEDDYSVYMNKDVTDSLQEQLNGKYTGIGVEITLTKDKEIIINQVFSNSPASDAGLKKGDVIASVDNVKVKSSAHFRYLLYKYDVGDTITVKCYRDSKFKEIKIKLTKSLNEA